MLRPAALALTLLAALAARAADVSLPHSGYVLDANDAPLTGAVSMRFRLFPSASGASASWESGACALDVRAGYFATQLGAGAAGCGTGLDAAILGAPAWLEVELDSNLLAPRTALPPTAASVALAELRSSLAQAGTLNAAGNPVDWTRLKGVPAGLADGTDEIGGAKAGGGLALVAGEYELATDRASLAKVSGGLLGATATALNASAPLTVAGDVTSTGGAFTGSAAGLVNVGQAAVGAGGQSVAQALAAADAAKIAGTAVDAAGIGDGKVLGFDLASGKLTYRTVNTNAQTESTWRGPAQLAAAGATLTGLVADADGLVLQPTGTDLVVTSGTHTVSNALETYRNITVKSGATMTVAAWDGTAGGAIRLRATGTVTIEAGALVTAKAKGYRGGESSSTRCSFGQAGESPSGVGARAACTRNGGGGGGGQWDTGNYGQAGAGGGYGTAGATGFRYGGQSGCDAQGGSTYGNEDLTTVYLGAGGGSGGTDCDKSGQGGHGGRGGGSISIEGTSIVVQGTIDAGGEVGGNAIAETDNGGGGGGAGGSILIWGSNVSIASGAQIVASGGAGGTPRNANAGGVGGEGRILLKGPVVSVAGTVGGTAKKIDMASAAPTIATAGGTWVSPALALPVVSQLRRVDVFANRAPETHLAADVCVADNAAGTELASCWQPVSPGGAVDVAANKPFARVRVSVVERGPAGSFRLRAVRLTTTP